MITGSTPPTRDLANFGGTIPFATPRDLGKGRYVNRCQRTLTNDGLQRAKSLPAGVVLVTCIGATIGKMGIAGRPLATNQQINAILSTSHLVDAEFIFDALQMQVGNLRALAGTQAVPIVNKSTLEEFALELPPLPEQRRIAKILRTWDEAIEKAERLIEASERRRHALLADLEQGRFGNGTPQAEWVSTTIQEVMTLASRRVAWDEDATYRLITVKRACGGLIFRGDRKGSEIKTKDMYQVRAGDFVISKRQVVHGAWAMATNEFDGTHVSKEYACFEPITNKLWMPFFGWLSRTKRLRHQALLCSYGVDIEKMVLDMDWLQESRIMIPASIDEQKRIAEVLDCAEREITLLYGERDALEKQKRGLMQKLLTGEWRLAVADTSSTKPAQKKVARG